MNTEVRAYFDKLKTWKPELEMLRELILECGLKEDYKWRNPCYMHQGKNIVLIGSSKAYFSLSFFKGALLKDQKKILQKIGQNTRSAKYISFTSKAEVIAKAGDIKDYIDEAIEVERKGLKVDYTKGQELEFPKELLDKFKADPEFKIAFNSLTRGRQRGYILHFSSAKQSKTRTSRIEKYENRIFNGKGMLDCVCGLSNRMPNCDGSHKHLGGVE